MSPLSPRDLLARYGPDVAAYAILTGNLGPSIVQPEFADRYIREAIERTTVINAARRIPMRSDTRNIDRLTHAGRVLQPATENVEPSESEAIGFAQRQLKVVEMIAAESWTKTTLEDNIEGDQLANTLIDVMASLYGRDWEELALYADADATSSEKIPGNDSAFFEILGHDGWLHMSDHMTDYEGEAIGSAKELFKQLLDSIPVKILDSFSRGEWRLYVSSRLERLYREELGERQTNLGDRALFENIPVFYDGVPVVVAPNFKFGTRDFGGGDVERVTDAMLVIPENLVVGVRREVDFDVEWKPRARRFELTFTTRADVQVEDPTTYATAINFAIPESGFAS